MLKNRFLDGDINEISQEFDDQIFISLTNDQVINEEENIELLIGVGLYIAERLKKSSKNDEAYYYLSELEIRIINDLSNIFSNKERGIKEPGVFDITWIYPNYIILLGKVLKLKIYNYKIKKSIDEFLPVIITFLPYLDSHKLFFRFAILNITSVYAHPKLVKHAVILNELTDVQSIISKEFRNKAINIRNGISGFYLLLNELEKIDKVLDMHQYSELILDKISKSDAWEKLDHSLLMATDISFFDGLSGIGYVIVCLMKKENYIH